MDIYGAQASLLKSVAHPVRLQILDALRDGERCVCDLAATLGLRQAYISQQLMKLRRAGLVTDRKAGLRVYYRVSDSELHAVLDMARGVVSRQAEKHGLATHFIWLDSAKSKRCACSK